MLDEFTGNPDVLWGFLVALAVVLALTPAVGRVARVLGVVDEPGERRRVHLRAVPRLGGSSSSGGTGRPFSARRAMVSWIMRERRCL